MTRPTPEQIKALRKGDVVTVRAVVKRAPDEDGDGLIVAIDGKWFFDTKTIDIMTIEPREIKVGDRVRDENHEGEVKAVCEGRAWVRFDTGYGEPTRPFMCDAPTGHFTVIP